MEDQKSGQGGAANTPPFPRRPTEITDASPAPGAAEATDSPTPTRAFAESIDSSGLADSIREPLLPPAGEDEGVGSPDRAPDAAYTASATSSETGRPGERAAEVHRRVERGLSRGFERIADRLDDAAERIERIAEGPLGGDGPRGRVGVVASTTAAWIEDVAGYLRSRDVQQMRADVERQVREKPLQTLLLAAGAGWLLGRIIR